LSGIAAILNLDQTPIDKQLLEQITQHLRLRGPDGSNHWIASNSQADIGYFGMAHSLLRVSFQSKHETGPCTLGDGVWISADVRLDDRARLISDLRAAGRDVQLETPDPELILHAYAVWEEDCLTHLLGDFAFILWDDNQQSLFCVRDPVGVVPFYYTQVGSTLLIGNTLQALRLHPGVSSEYNELAIANFLLFPAHTEFEETYFQAIHRLPPAHTLAWRSGQVDFQITRYYSLPEPNVCLVYKDPREYIERFLERFKHAVADRMVAPTIGVTMSGGMDSTSVAAIAQHLIKERNLDIQITAYTTAIQEMSADEEGKYSSYAAQYLAIQHEIIPWEEYLFPAQRPQYTLLPPAPVSIPHSSGGDEIKQRAASRGRLVFTGFGGDPIFRPRYNYWQEALQGGRLLCLFSQFYQHIRLTHHRPPLFMDHYRRQRRGELRFPMEIPDWIHPDFAKRYDLQERVNQKLNASEQFSQLENMLLASFWSNIFTNRDPEMTGLMLREVHPFFDLRLIEYMRAVPSLPWMLKKYLLREAMQGYLPDSILQRKKTPLVGKPHDAYARAGRIPSWYYELATAPELNPYIDLDRMRAMIQNVGQEDVNTHHIGKASRLAFWLQANNSMSIA